MAKKVVEWPWRYSVWSQRGSQKIWWTGRKWARTKAEAKRYKVLPPHLDGMERRGRYFTDGIGRVADIQRIRKPVDE